jgi:hypothetical protein
VRRQVSQEFLFSHVWSLAAQLFHAHGGLNPSSAVRSAGVEFFEWLEGSFLGNRDVANAQRAVVQNCLLAGA